MRQITRLCISASAAAISPRPVSNGPLLEWVTMHPAFRHSAMPAAKCTLPTKWPSLDEPPPANSPACEDL